MPPGSGVLQARLRRRIPLGRMLSLPDGHAIRTTGFVPGHPPESCSDIRRHASWTSRNGLSPAGGNFRDRPDQDPVAT